MAENQAPPQRQNEPVTEHPKPGYDASGDDPVAPVYDDEPVTDPPKPGYDTDSE